MTPPTDDVARLVEKLRGLLAKATKRPWRVFHSEYGNDTIAIMKGDRPKRYSTAQYERWPEIIAWPGFDGSDVSKRYRRANAELIVAAVNALPALLDRLSRPVGDWRPIDTAPRDHEAYLFISKRGAIRVDSFHRTQVKSSKHRWLEAPVDPYTHWQPLPPPPAPGGDA